jgi:predicted RNA binding protein YcfA (HicA-like mRNA interferase family)
MSAKQIQQILIKDGWIIKNQKGSHRKYIHELKKGKVTVPFHGKDEINPST